MTKANNSPFSASDSALGYLYQLRVALLWALRRLRTDNDFYISLETLDDITFGAADGKPEELLQTKHHQSREATLTNSSVDLWKSLRVWFEGYKEKTITSDAALYLITTGKAPEGSIASYLRSDCRNVDAALEGLKSVALSSENKTNLSAYSLFLNVSFNEQKKLIENIFVFDSASTITDLNDELKREIIWSVERKYLDIFLERIEGWWFRRSIKQLTSIKSIDRILGTEIEAQMSDLREQFKQDSLPIDDDLLMFNLDEITKTAHSKSIFVQQLEIIQAAKNRINFAIRDYYRAFEQRSRWLRDQLMFVGDLSLYEKRLVEEWEMAFERIKNDLDIDAAEKAKQKAALEILGWAETVSIPIRPTVVEPFITRGSLHILANEMRLGWHPDFRDRLATLLGAKEIIE